MPGSPAPGSGPSQETVVRAESNSKREGRESEKGERDKGMMGGKLELGEFVERDSGRVESQSSESRLQNAREQRGEGKGREGNRQEKS